MDLWQHSALGQRFLSSASVVKPKLVDRVQDGRGWVSLKSLFTGQESLTAPQRHWPQVWLLCWVLPLM